MEKKNLLKESKAYHEDNDFYEIFSEAKKCFEVIYGKEISNKINSSKIEHKNYTF